MKITYRPEIDGLRAIAVGSVILYHTQISISGHQPFQGGFIGVDIFFVISGYLITSIIFKELVTTGSFSFKNFYERRIRRILPVLLVVMLVSLPFAWIYLLPSGFIDFSKSILYSLGFSSNFYFHYTSQLYAAESGLYKPFLHTWSLSVEEQYYILFPIVLLITFKYFRKYLIHILIISFCISLGLADWGSRNHPSFNFYILPTRIWELLAGSILAYFEIINGYRSKNKILNLILPSIGLLLIGYSVLFFNDEMFHPSFYTLSPIVGVCLIIWFSNKDELITKILSTKLFVGIGLISYSLYLWHYPIFAFAREINLFNKNLSNITIIGISILILSIVSYHFVEKPFRNKNINFKKIIFFIFTTIIFLSIFCVIIIFNNGVTNRFGFNFLEEKSTHKIKNITGVNISEKNINLLNMKDNLNIFLVGDSHAETLSYELWKNFNNKYNLNFSIHNGCQFILNVSRVNKKTLEDGGCNYNMQQKRLEFINQTNNGIVILFGRLPLILNEERFNNYEFGFYEGDYEGDMTDFIQNKKKSLKTKKERQENIRINYKKTVQKLSKNNHHIILVYPMPEVGKSVPRIMKDVINKKNLKLYTDKNLFTTSYKIFKDRTKSSFELLDSIEGENIYRIYPHKLFCNTNVKERCLTHDEHNLFYYDDDHPSLKGGQMINDLIKDTIQKIEIKSN